MNNRLTTEEMGQLERLIDRHHIFAVLDAMADICHGKSEHVLTAWQDVARSRAWAAAGRKLDAVSVSKPIANLP
jgi:hypothetical protein